MLSIAVISSSSAAVSYYEKDDYYTHESDLAADHGGEQLLELLNGEQPGELPGRDGSDHEGTAVAERIAGAGATPRIGAGGALAVPIEREGRQPRGRTTFVTAKGSTYEVTEGGTTIRNKAARREHPGDSGPQPESERTFYVSPQDAQKLGEFQTQGVPKKIIAERDGSAGVQYVEGEAAGTFERRTMVPIVEEPHKGLIPVELWNGGRKAHFGNEITSVEPWLNVDRGARPGRIGEGEWYGHGAAALGLAGSVDRDAFKAVLEGHLPNGIVLRSTRTEGPAHTPGWDLTFSAPKSVSLLAEIGRDERLFEAHRSAVHEALGWLEREAVVYRQRTALRGRIEVPSNSMVAALFQHDLSRDQDPELHTHAVVANATQRQDASWGCVFSHPLFEHKMAAGVVYRAALAREVQQLGYDITPPTRDGLFEVSSVPQTALEAFQSRRERIQAWMAERGLSGPKAAAVAALKTRPSKRRANLPELRHEWDERSAKARFEPRQLVDTARKSDLASSVIGMTVPAQALQEAVRALSEPEAVFHHRDLVRRTLSEALGKSDLAHTEQAIARLHESGALESVAQPGRRLWTTPRAHTREDRSVRAAREGRKQVRAILSAGAVKMALGEGRLTDGQRAAVSLILSARDRFVAVVGRPGTGKTTMLARARELASAKGYEFVGMATNAEAARQLQSETGIASMTLHRHLLAVGRDVAQVSKSSRWQQKLLRRPYERQVWIVDEASQMDSGLMRRLTYAAGRLGARVVLVGDPQQLGAIEAGKPMALMLKAGLRHARMEQILRQADQRHVEAIRNAADDNISDALTKLSPDIRVHQDPNARIAAILNRFAQLPKDLARETLVLTARNADKGVLNAGIRAIRRDRGELAGELDGVQRLQRVFSSRADRRDYRFYRPGVIVLFSDDAPDVAVKGGDYLTVQTIDHDKRTVSLMRATGGVLDWDPRNIPGQATKVELHERRQTSLAPGEKIRWSRQSANLQLNNGQPLTVQSVADTAVTFKADDGRQVVLNPQELHAQHWDHAYASTVYSSQGKTAKHVLVNADSEQGALFSRKAFLVAVSRHRQSLTLYVDDHDKLKATLKRHVGDKTSAIEERQASRLSRAMARLEALQPRQRSAAVARTPNRGASR